MARTLQGLTQQVGPVMSLTQREVGEAHGQDLTRFNTTGRSSNTITMQNEEKEN